MFQILDLDKLRDTPIDSQFFPYCQIDCFIQKEVLTKVLHDFPEIKVRGSIPASKLKYGEFFQKLIDELHSVELRDLIAKKFSIDLSNSQTMLTIRGQTNSSDGHIHADTPSKLITLLLYLNDEWHENTGNLRLLRDNYNLENYFDEVKPTAGKLLVFKVTDNCWHGHHPFTGKRRTLQLNYVTSQKVVDKEMKKHARSYSLKQLMHKLRRLGYEESFVD
ncbi:MAG: 2OG-Fe(II) oxygenase [Gammaproteobacteria bacterium]